MERKKNRANKTAPLILSTCEMRRVIDKELGVKRNGRNDFGCLVLVGLVLALASAFQASNAFSMDEYTYMNAAESLKKGNLNLVLEGERGRFPLFPYLLSFMPFADIEAAGRVFNVLLAAGILFLTYRMTREFGSKLDAGHSVLFLLSNVFFLYFAFKVLTEPLFIFLYLLCVYLVYLSDKKPELLPLLGFSFALLVLTRFVGLYLFPVLLAYFWFRGRLGSLASFYGAAAVAVFLLAISPFLLFSLSSSGSYFGLFAEFSSAQLNSLQGAMSLPDKIPSYLMAAPFLLLFPAAFFLLIRNGFKHFKKTDGGMPVLIFLATAIPLFLMEIYGGFNYRLLRYAVVFIPLLSILAAAALKYSKPVNAAHEVALAAVALNLLFAAIVFNVVGEPNNEKHAAYREAGLYLAQSNCSTVFSNIPAVMNHYLKKPTLYLEGQWGRAKCVAISAYDAWQKLSIPASQTLTHFSNGIAIYEEVG